jgi:hypothetical protein
MIVVALATTIIQDPEPVAPKKGETAAGVTGWAASVMLVGMFGTWVVGGRA